VPRFLAARLRTLPAPDGRLLCRFATVSDVHIGEKHFGILGRLHDGQGARGDGQTNQTYAARALTAALEEAAAWGAELIVTKGDLTRRTAAAEVRDVGRLLAASSVPVETMLGNHDNQLGVNVRGVLASQGVRVPWRPTAVDLPGVRLVLANTPHSIPRHHNGQVTADVRRRVAELAGEAAATGTGVWVGLHHPPEMRPYPTVYPPGIPFDQSRALLSALAAAQPNTLVTCGHRHRNRRYGYGPLVISEVGSTKDYPGVWAGYKVFEGGVVQIVRRTSRPDVMAWTEGTRRAVNGQWQRWSPGRLEDRCFAVRWPLAP
jgi:3',5'-cyclic AMP phosphodiesterase CpdA